MRKNYDVNVRANTKSHQAEFGKSVAANDSFNRSLKGVSQGVTLIDGPLGGVASRLSALNSLMSSGTIAIAGFGVGLAAVGATLYASLRTFDEYERSQLKTEALIKATGNAAGLSAQQLASQADAVALSTLASVADIVEAQNVLQSFRLVSKKTFSEAIVLSQDMAEVFGGSARDKALQLGKALESPKDGLNALKRSGVSFTKAEREMISAMQDAGDIASAQQMVLSKLQEQIGGTGAAAAGGLAGFVDTMSQRWSELLKGFARSGKFAPVATSAIKSITSGLVSLRELVDPTIGGLERRLEELEAKSSRRGGGRMAPARSDFLKDQIANTKQRILELKAEEGDVAAINTLLAQAAQNIEDLKQRIPTASTERRGLLNRNGATEVDELQKELATQLNLRKQYLSQLQQIQDDALAHETTQAELKKSLEEEAAARQAKINEKKAQALARDKARADTYLRQEQNKLDRVYDQALAAENKHIELEKLRYERQLAQFEQSLIDIEQRGLLTAELKAQFDQAQVNAEIVHQAKLAEIRGQARKKEDKETREKMRTISDGYSALGDSLTGYLDRINAKEKSYVQVAVRLGKVLLDKEARESINKIVARTNSAAMGAYEALASIPYVGPALGAVAYGGIMTVGGAAAARVAGIAHGGMTSVPAEGTYILQRGERVLKPKQNADFTEHMKEQKSRSGDIFVEIHEAPGGRSEVQDFDEGGKRRLVIRQMVRGLIHDELLLQQEPGGLLNSYGV